MNWTRKKWVDYSDDLYLSILMKNRDKRILLNTRFDYSHHEDISRLNRVSNLQLVD
ncbi:MAG: hypothetical protein M5F18_02750 [Asgard group archaeon]|nr:hypothetical protein [Asgard group archaeon]